MQYDSYRDYKRAKTEFRRAQNAAIEQFIRKCHDDLNDSADVDIRLFWKLLKGFNPTASKIHPEIIYNGKVHNTPESVAKCFSDYFSDLYQPLNCNYFDSENKKCVDETYADISKTVRSPNEYLPGGIIQEHEMRDIVKSLKLRKAAGYDKIQHEHLRFGGSSIVKCLTVLFNTTVRDGHIPRMWKLGLVVPIFKGGDKCKTSLDSYKPVSLLSCVYKIFESIIQSRLLKYVLVDKEFPSPQQQGFQKNLGCLTASFNLQETTFHNLELYSKVYVAFLDSRKAFDTVWRTALMCKLYKLGVKGKIWSIIDDCHTNTKNSVVVNQQKSVFFNVKQGVRQGVFYQVYCT